MSEQESTMFPGRETSKEKFVWRATYENGKTLDQFEGEKANQCCDISREGLRSFEFIEEDKSLLKINLLIGDKFSFRRRTMVKTGEGMLARFYAVSVTYGDVVTYFWLDEESKKVEVVRLSVGDNHTGLFYAFSPVDNDNIIIS